MLRTIMGDLLSQQPDMVIAGESALADESLPTARNQRADVLITEQRSDAGTSCLDAVLGESPIGVFAVSADGRSATGVTLRPRRIPVESEGRSTLVEAVRRMAAEVREDPPGES